MAFPSTCPLLPNRKGAAATSLLTQRLQAIPANVRQSLLFIAATTLAFGLDYLFNLAAGRMLPPAEFGIVVSLAGVGQVLVVASRVVQTITTRYVSRFLSHNSGLGRIVSFFRTSFRSAAIAGAGATAVLILLSWPLADFLQIDDVRPVLALAAATWLMAVRPVVGGTLQGQQRFLPLGVIQIVQAGGRLLLAVGLISLGLGAFGAMAALPVSSLLALLFGLWVLRDFRRLQPQMDDTVTALPELLRYSAYTAAGLIGFALLINMDAILVKRFFDPVAAGNYATAVTLGKVIQFFPVAIIMILFPKAARRRAENRDTRAVLLPALAIVGGLCGLVALGYFLVPDLLISLIFGPAYALPPNVLGLIGVAMLLLSLANVWLNYYLSVERTRFVFLIWTAVLTQFAAMFFFHDALWQLPVVMAISGLWLTVMATAVYLIRGQW